MNTWKLMIDGGTRDKMEIDYFNKIKSAQPLFDKLPKFPQGPQQTLLACNELGGCFRIM